MPFDPFFTSDAKVKRSQRSWRQRTKHSTKSPIKVPTNEANHGYGPARKIWDEKPTTPGEITEV